MSLSYILEHKLYEKLEGFFSERGDNKNPLCGLCWNLYKIFNDCTDCSRILDKLPTVIEFIRYLVARTPDLVNRRTNCGNTPIHLTILQLDYMHSHIATAVVMPVMSTLLDLKVPVNAENYQGTTALTNASLKLAWLLLEHGAKTDKGYIIPEVKQMAKNRMTARYAALTIIGNVQAFYARTITTLRDSLRNTCGKCVHSARSGTIQKNRRIIDNRIEWSNKNVPTTKTGMLAIIKKHLKDRDFAELERSLIQQRDPFFERNPLHEVCRHLEQLTIETEEDIEGVIECARFLCRPNSGISINSKTYCVNTAIKFCGNTALNLATSSFVDGIFLPTGPPSFIIIFIKILLTHGASVHIANDQGDTPLSQTLSKLSANRFSKLDGGCGKKMYNELIWLLLDHGAIPPETSVGGNDTNTLIIKKMVSGRNSARQAARIIVGLKRYNRSRFVCINNIDIARLIARYVWETRAQYEVWDNSEKSKNYR